MDLVNTTTYDFPWLSTEDAARIRGVHAATIRDAIKDETLDAVRVGKPGRGRALLLIHPNSLLRWLPKSTKRSYRDKMPINPDAVPEEFRWIDSVEAGERKGLLGRTMQKVLERRELPYVKIGKPGKGRALYLIHEDDLEAWWPKWVASASSPMDASIKPGKIKKEAPRPRLQLPAGDEEEVLQVEGEWV